jgi:hypothetical protein
MASAKEYRRQADSLRKLAEAATDEAQAFAYRLRAVEYDYLAEQAESGGQVQQRGTQPPPAPPASADRPAQQQQQVQHKDDAKE